MILLLDTTVLIDVLRGRNDRRALLATLVERGHRLTSSALNVAEVYAGMRPSEEPATEAFLNRLECLPISSPIARRAGRLKADCSRRGRTVTLADMIVAATALEHGLQLMTDNRKDFPLPQLDLYPLT